MQSNWWQKAKMMEKTSRIFREDETRELLEREKSWKPPSMLPVPKPQDGYSYRWIRTSFFGDADNKNVSARFREGWEPVRAADHPELSLRSDKDSRFPDGVEVGGLLLCKTSSELVKQRRRYYETKTAQQMESVDNNIMKQNDPRMPLLRPEHRTTTTFGKSESSE